MNNKSDLFNQKKSVLPGGSCGRRIAICLIMSLLIIAVYGQVANHEFVNYDDPDYITENPHVKKGLTRGSITWAFTATLQDHWHPLTWLSHMTDCQLYGLNPRGHHLTGLLFHIINSLLLFIILERMTGAAWKSAVVAALFALHPLHVESVAWVTGRKDLLSTLFMILTIWTYHLYVEKPSVGRYILSVALFGMGLLSKSILVTLPFALLLIDYWPLCRLRYRAGRMGGTIRRLVLEKVPYFFLSVCVSFITLVIRHERVSDTTRFVSPLTDRMAYAVVSYTKYIIKIFWPHDLIIYSYPKIIPLWQVVGGSLLLVSITALALRHAIRRPYLPVGWFWFLGTLVPVIGLIQTGPSLMADRYTYVSLIGIFVMVVWGVGGLLKKQGRGTLCALAAAALMALMACSWVQTGYWCDSEALFSHCVAVNRNHSLAYCNLAMALEEQGRYDEAISHYNEAIRINPNSQKPRYNLGVLLSERGDFEKAIDYLSEVMRADPGFAEGHVNFGITLAKYGNLKDAHRHFARALEINPLYARASYNLGLVLQMQGRINDAVDRFRETLDIDPGYAKAHSMLGLTLHRSGNFQEAIDHFEEAMRLDPRLKIQADYNIARAYARQGEKEKSVIWLRKAVEAGFKDWNSLEADAELENIRGSSYVKALIADR
jgi:Flp pilus assembly protein TadD